MSAITLLATPRFFRSRWRRTIVAPIHLWVVLVLLWIDSTRALLPLMGPTIVRVGRHPVLLKTASGKLLSRPDIALMMSGDKSDDSSGSVPADEDVSSKAPTTDEPPRRGWKTIFGTKKLDRATLASMGTSVILSYGFVSNAFGCTAVSCAWYLASKKTGLSPLAPEQWKNFLGVYAGFFAFLNVIRPARFALSVYLSRYFESAVKTMQERFGCNKAFAVGLVVFLVNFCGSIALVTVGVATASALAGVPVWATK